MDDLKMTGDLGGAIALSSGYARNPLVIKAPGSPQPLAVVTSAAFVDIGGSITYRWFRVYVNFPTPILNTGHSGTVGQYEFTAPSVSLGTTPDSISDGRIGFDARLFGTSQGKLRLGAGAQLLYPSSDRADYVTDARYRAMFRVLAAGDSGPYTYAGQVGIHLRPLNDAPVPGSPHGNEVLYGVGAGRRFAGPDGWAVIAGPEVFGQTAVQEFFGGETGTEALLTGRLEQAGKGRNMRLKLGFGHALDHGFGAAQWRMVFGVELFGHK
jgi:hypothetical protein